MNTQAILKSCFHFISRNWLQLLLLTLPLSLIWQTGSWLISTSLQDTQAVFGELLLGTVIFSLIEAIAIYYVHGITLQAQGLPSETLLRPTALYKEALRLWLPMMQLAFIKMIVIGLGLMLFVVPGIIIAVRLALAEQHLVLRQASVFESLRMSSTLTAPDFFIILAALGYLFLLHLGYEYVSSFALEIMGVLLFPFGILIALFSTIAAYRIYTLLQPAPDSEPGET